MTVRSRLFSRSTLETARSSDSASISPKAASSRWVSYAFLVVLGALLVGYMFLGRGFAHLGIGPIFVGDAVLLLGVAVCAFVIIRERMRPRLIWLVSLIVAFAVLGAARTLPYLGVHGLEALRDGVLWGYAGFALIMYVLLDRASLLAGFRAYGWIVPVFALWLPICWNIFRIASLEIDPSRPGSVVPLVFFKAGDMAVHVVGAIAFLVLGTTAVRSMRTFVWRAVVCLPLLWTIFVAGTSNRGALLTSVVGIAAVVVVAPRVRNWLPILASVVVFVIGLALQGAIAGFTGSVPVGSEAPPVVGSTTPVVPSRTPAATRSLASTPTPTRTPMPTSSANGADADESPSSSADPGVGVRLANSGFEADPSADGQIEGWSTRAAELTLVNEGAHRGDTFASMSNPMGPYEATITSSRFTFDGPDIEVSAWAKAIRAEPTLEIYVNWYRRSGSLISSEFVTSLRTEGSRNWQRCAGRIAAPEGATSAAILFYEAAGSATLGVDEVTVLSGDLIPEILPPGSVELVNGDFEHGPVDAGTIDGWTPRGALVTTLEGRAHDGDRFASVENAAGPYEATLRSTRFAFEDGQDIQVSLWVSAIDAGPTLEIYVNWYDRSGEQISSVFLNSLVTDGDRTWQEVAGFLPSPPGTARAQILLYEATGHSTMGIDDVTVTSGDFIPEPGPAARPGGRPATIGQMIDNIFSLFGSSADGGLEGTKQFRLAWWGTIVDYTVFGEYFWTGKGFGVNLADDDGFQSTADGSLRAPHNSHLTVLARMGVPGIVLWVLLQVAFGLGLLRATLHLRHTGAPRLAAIGAWILVYWTAMMVDTSFDPYLEGPQGGIWFWSLIGVGLVVMRMSHRDRNV